MYSCLSTNPARSTLGDHTLVLVSNKIWSSGASSHKVCALKSHACGVPFSTDSSQIWFVCESRCQTQMPSNQKFSRSTWRSFKPRWAFLLQAYLFQRYHIKNWESNLLTSSVPKQCKTNFNKNERKQSWEERKSCYNKRCSAVFLILNSPPPSILGFSHTTFISMGAP